MPQRHVHGLRLILFTLFLFGAVHVPAATHDVSHPRTTDNDDTCDISLLPAATLLLPYFEVDVTSRQGETTLITVTNTSNVEQVAHVVLWTDWGFPVIDFNVYLTGYDVQSLNLYDIIVLGQIAPTNGTGFEDSGSPVGELSHDNALLVQETCRSLPMLIPNAYKPRMIEAFTTGRIPALGNLPACTAAGSANHADGHAVGYATIDLVSSCIVGTPEDQDYYNHLLFDNVLVGDYQQVNLADSHAQSSPLVHIRAIPEGDTPGMRLTTNLKRTFYSRHQSGPDTRRDARQPLPSTFAAHWISGGTGSFQTKFKIWREGATGPNPACNAYAANRGMKVAEIVRFDEEENFTILQGGIVDPPLEPFTLLPATSLAAIDDAELFPYNDDAIAGWVYLNLDTAGNDSEFANQAWVVTSMRAEGRFSGDADASALGNGCSPRAGATEAYTQNTANTIGPAENPNP
jgi:hypothetical protein